MTIRRSAGLIRADPRDRAQRAVSEMSVTAIRRAPALRSASTIRAPIGTPAPVTSTSRPTARRRRGPPAWSATDKGSAIAAATGGIFGGHDVALARVGHG